MNGVRRTVRTNGAQGLFRGLSATIYREAVGWASFFATYDYLKNNRPDFKDPWMQTAWKLNAGGLSGFACWLTTLPADNIKTL